MSRRFAFALFMAANLLPWESAFACHVVGFVQLQCCCEAGVAPCPRAKAGQAGCCTVVAARTQQLSDVNASSLPAPDQHGKMPAPPPELSIVAVAATGIAARVPRPSPARKPWLQGTQTYKYTARLRL